ncbi:transposase [Legionella busanensis]|uniref:Transposase n=1 Tax=Legionella busanensis TaxID=190655 RepID=A0A378JLL9_9GAMM|nr:transposase [Legionella busanensis]
MDITTYIPLFNTRSGTAQRTITPGFYYDANNDTYRCPANHKLNPGKILDNDYVLYHSRVKHCRDCSIKTSCQASKKKNQDIRVISRHTHFHLLQQVTLDMQTALFKQKLVERLA